MEPIKWTTEDDGYSVAERLLEGVMFEIDVELNLVKVKEAETFFTQDAYTITDVRPKTPADRDYLIRLGGESVVTHWCDKIKARAQRSEAELITDEIFNLPQIKELWEKYEGQ